MSICHLHICVMTHFLPLFDRLTMSQILIVYLDRDGLGLLDMVWSCEVGHRESFGLARVWINEVRISKGLLYQKMIPYSLEYNPRALIGKFWVEGDRINSY